MQRILNLFYKNDVTHKATKVCNNYLKKKKAEGYFNKYKAFGVVGFVIIGFTLIFGIIF